MLTTGTISLPDDLTLLLLKPAMITSLRASASWGGWGGHGAYDVGGAYSTVWYRWGATRGCPIGGAYDIGRAMTGWWRGVTRSYDTGEGQCGRESRDV